MMAGWWFPATPDEWAEIISLACGAQGVAF